MGTKLAPAYANIFMGKLEHIILSSAPLKPSFYKRYIDDILILWPHSITELNNFITALNNYHPSIKFTYEFNPDKITFLDVNIYKGPSFTSTKKLEVETHIKPTNRQAYIHADSYHPPGTSKGVAIGEMKRYLRTNSRAESFYTFKSKHKLNLRKRGYSTHFINRYTNSVQFNNRHLTLKPKTITSKKKRLAFVTRFTPLTTKVMKVIRKFWPSLRTTRGFRHKTIPSPMLTFKSNRNIKSYLVRAKLPSLDCHTTPLSSIEFPLNFSPNTIP